MTFDVQQLQVIEDFNELVKDDGHNWFAVFTSEEGAHNFARQFNGIPFKQVRSTESGYKYDVYYVKLI